MPEQEENENSSKLSPATPKLSTDRIPISINDIPTEILQQILLFFSTDKVTRARLNTICRRWRQIMISTPELWTRITIKKRIPEDMDLYKRKIARSGEVPLDVLWGVPFLGISDRDKLRAQLELIPFERWG